MMATKRIFDASHDPTKRTRENPDISYSVIRAGGRPGRLYTPTCIRIGSSTMTVRRECSVSDWSGGWLVVKQKDVSLKATPELCSHM